MSRLLRSLLRTVRWEFRAYDKHGRLLLHTWAEGPMIDMERRVYQDRLNRGDFMWVDVHSTDPAQENFRMFPQRVKQ